MSTPGQNPYKPGPYIRKPASIFLVPLTDAERAMLQEAKELLKQENITCNDEQLEKALRYCKKDFPLEEVRAADIRRTVLGFYVQAFGPSAIPDGEDADIIRESNKRDDGDPNAKASNSTSK